MRKIVINLDVVKKIWIIFGVALLITMSPFFQFLFGPLWYFNANLLPTLPFMLGIVLSPLLGESEVSVMLKLLSIIISSAFPLVFFVYGSLKNNTRYFTLCFFILVTAIMFYDMYFIYSGWEYAIHYRGSEYLRYAAIRNIIAFSLVYLLVGIYYKKRNVVFLHIALLLFCATISIVSFPYIGEVRL